MTTYIKVYSLVCGTMIKKFGIKKPTFKDVELFIEKNSPTNNEVMLMQDLKKVATIPVSWSPKAKHKRLV